MKKFLFPTAIGCLLSFPVQAKTLVKLDCQLIQHDVKQYEREANFAPLAKRSLFHLHIVRGMLSTQRREMFAPLRPIKEDVVFLCQQAISPKQFERRLYTRDSHHVIDTTIVHVPAIPFAVSCGEQAVSVALRVFKKNMPYCKTPPINSKKPRCSDCSLIPYLSYRSVGRSIPRSASGQCDTMRRVDYPQAGDIPCFSKYPNGSITHSGLMLDAWTVLHATVRKGVLMHSISRWTLRKKKHWFGVYFRYYVRPS